MEIKLLHLYYDIMNLYGEYGNIKILEEHLKDQGYTVMVDKKTLGEEKNLEEYDFIFDGIKINVSASFGVEGIGENESVETLLERADKKLYEAKRNGRNRVIG